MGKESMIENIDKIQELLYEIESLSQVLAICLEHTADNQNHAFSTTAWMIRDKAAEVSTVIGNCLKQE